MMMRCRPLPLQYSAAKRFGAHYTPLELAEFVAERALKYFGKSGQFSAIDPAMGDGALLQAVCQALRERGRIQDCALHGFDTNPDTLAEVAKRIDRSQGYLSLDLRIQDFLDHALSNGSRENEFCLFETTQYDLVVANPPYVRTQILGASRSKELAEAFALDGRVDLSSAFIVAIGRVLAESGIASIIVSNRFMKTTAGSSVRRYLAEQFDILEIWDFGDTRLFEAAVLPAVLVLRKKQEPGRVVEAKFTSIYSTRCPVQANPAKSVLEAIRESGDYTLEDSRSFRVSAGLLDITQSLEKPWRLSNSSQDSWLARVSEHTHARFRDVGKIRVGVKTTADSVFINSEWAKKSGMQVPELVRPLITHVGAQRWRMGQEHFSRILYTHETVNGKRRPVDLGKYPISAGYLAEHRKALEGREYLRKAGRQWYEIWVPQDPELWKYPKIVFRDICESPTFWMDTTGAIVNGDCYWITCNTSADDRLLWLALAIANTSFVEEFYDHCFNNKLYAGRRRFMTQYVENFPICDPDSMLAKELINIAKTLHGTGQPETEADLHYRENLVRKAFGV
jgi:adenine-specific DNA-methyltransferase